MQEYIKHIDRIEFEMTMACTGRCRHCSQGDCHSGGAHIDGAIGAALVRRLCEAYPIKSLMTFGGEPLLYPEDTCAIQRAAREAGIPKRHIITNGYFSKSADRIAQVADMISVCGVTKVYLSVDAFHQETIPLQPVLTFAKELHARGVFVQTHPAWLVSPEDMNPYNAKTSKLLAVFSEWNIGKSTGNVIFPSGNALKYLGEYFDPNVTYVNPYEENPRDVHTVSIGADGDVLGGNINRQDIMDILAAYRPGY